MSIWSVRCLGHRFSRQAYIWGPRRALPLSPSFAPYANVGNRPAHSSLYQMHFGDARSYSNAQDVLKSSQCDKGTSKTKSDDACAEFERLRRRAKSNMGCCPPVPNPCGGGGGGCPSGSGSSGGSGSGSGKGGGDDYDKVQCIRKKAEEKYQQLKKRCLAGLIAALLAGGLIAWLIGNSKKDVVKEEAEKNMKRAKVSGLITTPRSSDELPKKVPYLIVGGGTAAFSAFRAIKSNDAKAKVLMISNEYRKPYMRPPLSKELWYTPNPNEDPIQDYRFKQWTGSERSLYFEPEEFFVDPTNLEGSANGGIAVAQGFAVKKIDAQNRIATLNDGYQIGYDVCLIATGCTPKNLPVFRDSPPSVREKVMVYRTPEDFDRLRRYARERRSITIVGNGFVGSELACSLAHYSKENKGGKVYQVFQESGNMSKVLPNYLSRWTTQKMEAQGVCVIPEASIKSASRNDSQLQLELNNGMTLLSDIVVVCVGCSPNTALAGVSKLEVDRSLGGFVVNAELEARRNLYVAGDASCFYDPLLGRRRVEHHDHSVVSGRLAGENMTGAKKPYTHQSMFWSDLGPEIGYEGIGMVDSSLPTVGVFALPSSSAKRADSYSEAQADSKEKDKGLVIKKSSGDKDKDKEMMCNPEDSYNYGKGVIFYLKNDKIVGILLWNLFNRIGLARTIINQNADYDDLNEVAKLFEIHT